MPERRTAPGTAVSLAGTCPNCQAPAGKPCTVPTDASRRPVSWYHFGRYEAGLNEMTRTKEGPSDDAHC